MEQLTKKQADVLAGIKQLLIDDSELTLVTLAEHLGLTRASSVVGHVRALERKGCLPVRQLVPATGGPGGVVRTLAEWVNGSKDARKRMPQGLMRELAELTAGTDCEVTL